MKTRVIGDIHGNYDAYLTAIQDVERSIQVGDFGMGFFRETPVWEGDHRFIRGNHDNPAVCKAHPKWIPDGRVENGVMYVGGAWSIDAMYRTENVDWWIDEEISYDGFQSIIDVYAMTQPRVMITHDAPAQITYAQQRPMSLFKNRTMQALQAMFDIHKPEIWIYGHWHKDRCSYVSGCKAYCLGELSYLDLEL